jgi:organic hydroperoxide reductase OsmC/OhrA
VGDKPSTSDPEDTVKRGATVSWLTHPPEGKAWISGETHALSGLKVSVPERDPAAEETTPGELMAVAAGMILAWALAEVLIERGAPANELVVKTECTFTGAVAERQLIGLRFDIDGRVPGLHSQEFQEAAVSARRRYLLASGARTDLRCELEATVIEPFD